MDSNRITRQLWNLTLHIGGESAPRACLGLWARCAHLREGLGRPGVRLLDQRSGKVVEFDAYGRILDIEEKPAKPRSSIAGSGLQVYDNAAVDSAFRLKPCFRVELEITDVNEAYLNRGNLRLQVFWGGSPGWTRAPANLS